MNSVDEHGAPVCPDASLLAAFVDRTLKPEDARAITVHLAGCPVCRAVVAGAAETLDNLDRIVRPAPGTAVPPSSPRRRCVPWLLAAGTGIAALIILAVVLPRWSGSDLRPGRPELAGLVAAIGDQRPFEARLTGGFKPGPLWPVMRSGAAGGPAVPPDVRAAAARLAQEADARPSTSTRAAAATADLVVGRVDDAIARLEALTRERPDQAMLWNDLAAACLVRHAGGGGSVWADKALQAADRALALDPELEEALFNRALALEAAGNLEAARAAWQVYDRRFPDSPWRR